MLGTVTQASWGIIGLVALGALLFVTIIGVALIPQQLKTTVLGESGDTGACHSATTFECTDEVTLEECARPPLGIRSLWMEGEQCPISQEPAGNEAEETGVAPPTTQDAQLCYRLIDLSDLFQDDYTNWINNINNEGHIVGYERLDNYASALHIDERFKVTDLGRLRPDTPWMFALGENDNDQSVGLATDDFYSADRVDYGWFYDGATMHDIGNLGGDDAVAESVNDEGIVVGASSDGPIPGDGNLWGIKWDMVNGLVSLPFPPSVSSTARATDINNNDVIVGSGIGRDSGGQSIGVAIVWNEHREPSILPRLGNSRNTNAWAINDRNEIAGVSNNNAVFWTADYEIRDLGRLRPEHTFALSSDINNHGYVVGTSSGAAAVTHQGFIYTPELGRMRYIGDFLPREDQQTWRIAGLTSINDAGQIIGTARRSENQYHYPVLLQPCSLRTPTPMEVGS